MAVERVLNVILRAVQAALATVVIGITGWYINKATSSGASSWHVGRFIYTVAIAAFALLLSLLWMIPLKYAFAHWPLDVLVSILFFISFGLLVEVSSSHER